MAEGVAFIEGQYVPSDEAKISVFDLGFSRSDAVYDVVSTWKSLFFRLDDHIDRFLRSCAGVRIVCPYPKEEIKRILAKKNSTTDAGEVVRLGEPVGAK